LASPDYKRAMPNSSVPAFVYVLRCRDGSLYCGWTTDPRARAAKHNQGLGGAYTRSHRPVKLVYVERCSDRSAALKREIAIKRLSRPQKLALIRRKARRVHKLSALSPNGAIQPKSPGQRPGKMAKYVTEP
jgi:putative endonuclease